MGTQEYPSNHRSWVKPCQYPSLTSKFKNKASNQVRKGDDRKVVKEKQNKKKRELLRQQ
jgi:hypothetical protein